MCMCVLDERDIKKNYYLVGIGHRKYSNSISFYLWIGVSEEWGVERND